jgi:hypothetical protein
MKIFIKKQKSHINFMCVYIVKCLGIDRQNVILNHLYVIKGLEINKISVLN